VPSKLEAAGNLAPATSSATLEILHAKHAAVLTVLVEVEAAEAAYQQALELARRVGDRWREMEILARLGNMYNLYHREVPAMEYNEQALAIARELHDRAFQAVCLANRVYIRSGGVRGDHRNNLGCRGGDSLVEGDRGSEVAGPAAPFPRRRPPVARGSGP
jgi:hypothetical protein